jgi:hypothetical protein
MAILVFAKTLQIVAWIYPLLHGIHVMRVAIKTHNGFEEHGAVHQDTIISLISLDTSLENIVPFDGEDSALDVRGTSVRVADFSTQGDARF